MLERRRFLSLLSIMIVLTLTVGSIAIISLYNAAVFQLRERLRETAQSQARLMEAVARFDKVHSQNDNPKGAAAATLSQIVDARNHYKGFGDTGEFTLAKLENNKIVFLISHRHYDLDNPKPVPLDSKLAEPMRRALLGESGTIVGIDYRGVKVLAAHEPVTELNFGIVAKIDLSEIRKPFVKAGTLAGIAAFVLILFGVYLFYRISNPMLKILEQKKKDLEMLVSQRTLALEKSNDELNREIGKRKHAFEEIRIYERIFAASTEHISFIDRNYVYQAVNETYLSAHNKKRDEIIGKTIPELMGADIFETMIKERVDSCLAGKKIKYQDWFEFNTTGRRFMDVVYFPYIDENGKISGLVVDSRDITERKIAENQLLESEQRFRKAILHAPYQVMMHAEGEVIQLSNSWSEITGYTIEDIPTIKDWINRAYGTSKLGSKMNDAIFKLYDLKESETIHEGEWPIKTKLGETRIWDFSTAPLGILSDGRRGVISMASDVTERRQLEEQLRQSQKMEAVGTLAGGIAHDFNTLIGTIIGYTNVISNDIQLDSPIQDDLEAITKVANRAKKLVKQIRDFSRPNNTEKEPIDIILTIRSSLEFVRNLIPKTIRIEESYEIEGQMIYANEDQINQVLVNLFTNASDFMDSHEGKLKVFLEKVNTEEEIRPLLDIQPGSYIKLSVTDNGRGIDPVVLNRVFDPYFTTKKIGKGSGLGLSIVHSIIKSHQGYIFAESKLSEGATFTIFLPTM